MMFEVEVQTHFSAAHHLRNYQGACENPHGHNWEVVVHVRGEQLDEAGLLLDFKLLRSATKEILEELDHTDINTHEAFLVANPSSENISRYLHGKLSEMLDCARYGVYSVTVEETRGARATYWK
jgi:6-pyruvoyltetrahydropterin/6-carboxytetrahydropterin synthase